MYWGLQHDTLNLVVKELITPSELAAIEKSAAKHGLRLVLPVKIYANKQPKYAFEHPEQEGWFFVIDWDWHKRRIRFHKRFIEKLQQAGILASVQRGDYGKHCSVEEGDFERALSVCTVAVTHPVAD